MYHFVSILRPHRAPNHGEPVKHEAPAETLQDAFAIARQQMVDSYADPFELQNEDRTTLMDRAAFMAAMADHAAEVRSRSFPQPITEG